jgi:hypothetical protein
MQFGMDNGLDLSKPDTLTETEWKDFTRLHGTAAGYPDGHPLYRFWIEAGRPDVVKAQRTILQTAEPSIGLGDPRSRSKQGGLPSLLAKLLVYILTNFHTGVEYQVRLAAQRGYSRAEVLDVFALAALHSAASGVTDLYTRHGLMDQFKNWPNDESTARLPDNWDRELGTLKAGLDFSEPELSAAEHEALMNWYLQYLGEVPPWVTLLAEYNPRLLKQLRSRWENAVKALPRQFVPFAQLVWHLIQQNEEGIRENLLLARGFNMNKDQVVATATIAALTFGGPTSLSAFQRAGDEIFKNWEMR